MVSLALLLDTAWSCVTLGAFGLMAGLLIHEGQMAFRRRSWQRRSAPARVEVFRPVARVPEFTPIEREPVTLLQAAPVASA